MKYRTGVSVLIKGGSIPAGTDAVKGYTGILYERFKTSGLRILNGSASGATTFDGIVELTEEFDENSPGILVLHYGIDDMYRPVYRSEFKENLVQMCRRGHERGITILLPTFQTFKKNGEAQAAEIYYRTVREVAMDLSCVYIPVHIIWDSIILERGLNRRQLVQDDCRYLTDEGQVLMAEIIGNRLEKLIHSISGD